MDEFNDEIIYNSGNFAFRSWQEPYLDDEDEELIVYDIIKYVPNELYGKISEYKLSNQNTEKRFYYKEPYVYNLIEETVFDMKLFPEVIANYIFADGTDEYTRLVINEKFIKECNSIGEFMHFVNCTKYAYDYFEDYLDDTSMVLSTHEGKEVLKRGDYKLSLTQTGTLFGRNTYVIDILKENKYYQNKNGWTQIPDKPDFYVNYDESEFAWTMHESYFDMPKLPYTVAVIKANPTKDNKISLEILCKDNALSVICKDAKSTMNLLLFLKESINHIENCDNKKEDK